MWSRGKHEVDCAQPSMHAARGEWRAVGSAQEDIEDAVHAFVEAQDASEGATRKQEFVDDVRDKLAEMKNARFAAGLG